MNEILKKHSLTILCVLSIVLLALPMVSVTASYEVFGHEQTSEASASGFSAMSSGIFGYLMVVGPALLIAMNYIKPIEKYKGILAVAVPVVCLIALIITVMNAGSLSASASNEVAEAEVSVSVSIGAILVGLSYVATAIAGMVTYHNFNLSNVNLDKIKNSGANLISAVQSKTGAVQSKTSESVEDDTAPVQPKEKPSVYKTAMNVNRVDEILALIERLAKMKESGILTEDEFAQKKQQLLEEL